MFHGDTAAQPSWRLLNELPRTATGETVPDPIPTPLNPLERLRTSALAKALLIGALVLFLQIPVVLIWNLVSERDETRLSAQAEVTGKWGKAQEIHGPFLVVPYTYLQTTTNNEGKVEVQERAGRATFLPRLLNITGELDVETRYRGIYEISVYRSRIEVEGQFDRPDFSGWDVESPTVMWDRAQLVFEISDARAIQNQARLRWRNQEVDFEPGTGLRPSQTSGIHAPAGGLGQDSPLDFSCTLHLNGSMRLRFVPLGDNTEVRLEGNWPDPSFQGQWLPVERQVGPAGFSATWRIPHLGRNYPRSWQAGDNVPSITASEFGVDLLSPVDAYRQTERSLKYELLFLGLTFTVIWLFEVLGGLRLHVIQYALIGAAMCIFYLLEVSLAEHLGFAAAYSIAAAAVVALVVFYGFSILQSRGRTAVIGAVLTGLYSCLYVLLQIQDYALLIGSLGLFVVLAAVMYATRRVDWHALRLSPGQRG